jgi:hypothetical protein
MFTSPRASDDGHLADDVPKAFLDSISTTKRLPCISARCTTAMAPTPTPSAPSPPSSPSSTALELRHVLLFHRHGDRTPVLLETGDKLQATDSEKQLWASRIASDAQLERLSRVGAVVGRDTTQPPNIAKRRGAAWPCGVLTSKGVEHMTRKGRALRERYCHLLSMDAATSADGSVDVNDQVYVLSSSIPRTIESVQCLLDGFFNEEGQPPKVEPVYVHTFEKNVLAPEHPIRVFFETESMVSAEVAKRSVSEREETDKLAAQLREILGLPQDRVVPWTAIRDALTCRQAHGLSLPEGLTPEMVAQVHAYDAWQWHALYSQHAFCFGAFQDGVREVYEHFKKVVNDDEGQLKLAFFSAHDNSIVALVCALGLQINGLLPEYGTIVAFEVYRDPATREHFIKAIFDGSEVVFAGHENDVLCPFSHVEKLALTFLEEKDA